MSAFWIVRINVTDPDTYPEYVRRVPAVLGKYGGRFIARAGRYTTMEGDDYERNVIIEFPSYEAAVACYRSPEYQAVLSIRLSASVGQLVVVEGVPEAAPS